MKHIVQTSGLHQELTESLLERGGDPVLGALLLAKAAIASERGIELRVSDDPVMTRSSARRAQGAPSIGSEDLITLPGNLIDNALDAAAAPSERWASVSVNEQEGERVINVPDCGAGSPGGVDGQIIQ